MRLFLDVVAAVAHAHSPPDRSSRPEAVERAGDPRRQVKLLDFGIAKLLDTETGAEDDARRPASRMRRSPRSTPRPSNCSASLPSTATDVYQLGMLLYVLLTGRHPLRLSGSRSERIKAALNGKLPRASEFAAGTLRKQLRGDLDAILGKAMHSSPLERYQTAAALRDDLVRYLNRDPVSARRGTRRYSLAKFIARHRVTTVVSLLAIAILCGTLVFALAQARLASAERDHALSLASRNAAVTEFLGTLITEAAESDKPVTVNEMLERSEKLALANTGGSPETRAAVLAMVAGHYGTLNDGARAARLLENGLALLAGSHDQSLRSELTCLHAVSIAELGQINAAVIALDREIQRLADDPDTAANCLLFRAYIATNTHDLAPALRYAQEAYRRFQHASYSAAGEEGLYLGELGLAYHLNGRNHEADDYFRRAMQKYIRLGRESSASATSVRNNWAIMFDGAGAPKRALELYDRTLALIAASTQDGSPPSYLIGNRAKSLYAVGRYAQARAAYEAEARATEQLHDLMGLAHALSGLASLSLTMHDNGAAANYLQRLSVLLKPVPQGAPPWRMLVILQGKLDMDAGHFAAASEKFSSALAEPRTSLGLSARLGRSEAELRSGDAAAAAVDARLALNDARAMQGDLPYSCHTGLSWLALGRAQLQIGQDAEAQQAFENAEVQLSNTVDDGHPALAEARSQLSARIAQVRGNAQSPHDHREAGGHSAP